MKRVHTHISYLQLFCGTLYYVPASVDVLSLISFLFLFRGTILIFLHFCSTVYVVPFRPLLSSSPQSLTISFSSPFLPFSIIFHFSPRLFSLLNIPSVLVLYTLFSTSMRSYMRGKEMRGMSLLFYASTWEREIRISVLPTMSVWILDILFSTALGVQLLSWSKEQCDFIPNWPAVILDEKIFHANFPFPT